MRKKRSSSSSLGERIKTVLWDIRDDRKKQIIAVSVLVVLFLLITVSIVFAVRSKNVEPVKETVEITTDEVETASGIRFLDGMPATEGNENRYPIMIMIENLVTIRDIQSGLQNAGVVYEVLAEGGITRFGAVYTNYLEKDEAVKEFAPVRSARQYFVDIAKEYGALYVHAGGSPGALEDLAVSEDVINLDQIGGDEGFFYRVNDTVAPHNLNTSTELLIEALKAKEVFESEATFTPWEFKTETPEKDREETVSTISIPYTSESYASEYVYDKEKNLYMRSNGGLPHVDKNTGEQISVKNVVVQFADTSLLEADTGRLDIAVVGEGKAYIFQEGQVIEGTWSKEDETARTYFYDENEEKVSFIPGNTWVSIVPTDNDVTYQ